MAVKTRSALLATLKETTEGTLKWPSAGTDFTVLREGFSFEGNVETVESDELVNDIGSSEGFITKETPSASIPKYLKHSGTEGTAPDYGELIESCLGTVTAIGTQTTTDSGSTAGSASARAQLVLVAGAGATHAAKGRAFLIKDGTNGYAIRNIHDVSTDTCQLNFNLAAAPASGVGLGKPIHYSPTAEGHPTISCHLYQGQSSSAFHDAIAGARVTGMQMEFPANDLAQVTFDLEGTQFFRNPIQATSSAKHIDFNVGAASFVATLDEKTYKSPVELARVTEAKMNAAASVADITVRYSSTTGKFTFAKGAGSLELEWQTGTNTATNAAELFGFSDAADDTGSTTYVADNALTYNPAYTASFDAGSPRVVKHNELMIGTYSKYLTRQAQSASFSIDTPKTDLDDLSAESGVSESVTLERKVTGSAMVYVKQHEVDDFDAFINNTTVSVMLNHGTKSGGNWVAGTCVNVYMPNAKLTATPLGDQDGVLVYEVEFMGFVSSTQKDIHINFL